MFSLLASIGLVVNTTVTAFLAATSEIFNTLIHTAAGTPQTWFNNPVITTMLWRATWETLAMTFTSSLLTVIIGVPIGLALVATAPGGIRPAPVFYQVLSLLVNIGRSIPFVILIIALIPITRLIMGSALGWTGAVLSLTVASVPFFARLVESNIIAVDHGKVEAAYMMGASRGQIMFGVQVREALPGLIQSLTVLIITLIGYSTMAGVFGNGGLGALAQNYGYVQYMTDVMVVVIIVVVVMVQIIQMLGDMISRWVDHR